MKTWCKPVVVISVIALAVLLSASVLLTPKVQPQNAPPEVFSAARAVRHVERIAIEPHPAGSAAQEKARDYIVSELERLGLEPEIQTGYAANDAQGILGLVPYAGDVENISVRIAGTAQNDEAILMLAHYDSTYGGPGAADDASGVATLLETIRALTAGPALQNDVIFLFTDGEEAGLLGATLYADTAPALPDIRLVMNFEARGSRGPSVMFETSDQNGWIMEEFVKSAPSPIAYSFTQDVYKLVSNMTDFTPFRDAGKAGLNFANLGGMETYHNPQDTPENLSLRFLQHQGSYALSLARHFGNLPLADAGSPNAVYFTVMRSVTALYPEGWAIPLAVSACAVFIGALIVGCRKKRITVKGTVQGFGVSILMFAAAAGAGIAAQLLFSKLYYKPENVATLTDLVALRRTLIFNGNLWMITTLVFSVLLLLVLHRLFSRRIAGSDLLSGSLLTWAILAVLSGVFAKGASYLFVWPALLVSAGLLTAFLMDTGNRINSGNLVLFVLAALSCILLFVPVGYLLFQALTMLGAGIPIGLLALPVGLVIAGASVYIDHMPSAGNTGL